jgi:hypothetical protein
MGWEGNGVETWVLKKRYFRYYFQNVHRPRGILGCVCTRIVLSCTRMMQAVCLAVAYSIIRYLLVTLVLASVSCAGSSLWPALTLTFKPTVRMATKPKLRLRSHQYTYYLCVDPCLLLQRSKRKKEQYFLRFLPTAPPAKLPSVGQVRSDCVSLKARILCPAVYSAEWNCCSQCRWTAWQACIVYNRACA